MKNIEEAVRERTLIFDGAMGTLLMGYNLSVEDYEGHKNCYDLLNLTRPDIVKKVHASYFEVGCDIVETNSFSANPLTFSRWGIARRAYTVAERSAEIAKKVAKEFSTPRWPRFVSGAIGPGYGLPTLLQADFDTLYNSYLVQARALIYGGVDIIQVETSQDILQIKAALISVFDAMEKCNRKIPVMVQATVEKNGKMLPGTSIEALIATTTPFDILALGINCGTGPDSIYEIVKIFSEKSPFLISVLPNAGLPKLVKGKLLYSLGPEKFADHLSFLVKKYGVHFVGGCCGTTPLYIKAVYKRIKSFKGFKKPVEKNPSFGASTFRAQNYVVNPRPLIINENINLNNPKVFRETLLKESSETMFSKPLDQQDKNVHILGITLACTGKNEEKNLVKTVKIINRYLKIPLCIGLTDPVSLEAALKCYGGRALINSINLKDGGKTAQKIIRMAKRYGAAVIGLTVDENGAATTAKEKVEVAGRIIALVEKEGLSRKNLMINTFTFTLGSRNSECFNDTVETFNAIKEIKKKFPDVLTALKISSCSSGFTSRLELILNTIFLYHAVDAGLDAAILHTEKVLPMHLIEDEEKKFAEDIVFK